MVDRRPGGFLCPALARLSPSSFPALPQLLPALLRARSARSEDALADSPRFSQILPDSPRLSQILRFSPMLPDSPRFSQILPDSPTLSQTLLTLPSSPRLSRTLPNVARLCQTQTRFPFMLLQVFYYVGGSIFVAGWVGGFLGGRAEPSRVKGDESTRGFPKMRPDFDDRRSGS